MGRTTSPTIDVAEPGGGNAVDRLRNDRVGWLTTVAGDGTPKTTPVWFLWSDDEVLVYSLESARVANLAARPRVSLNLDGNGLGGGIVVVEGTARIDRTATSADHNPGYLAKYRAVLDEYGWTPEWFAGRYCVPIRITPTGYRYW